MELTVDLLLTWSESNGIESIVRLQETAGYLGCVDDSHICDLREWRKCLLLDGCDLDVGQVYWRLNC